MSRRNGWDTLRSLIGNRGTHKAFPEASVRKVRGHIPHVAAGAIEQHGENVRSLSIVRFCRNAGRLDGALDHAAASTPSETIAGEPDARRTCGRMPNCRGVAVVWPATLAAVGFGVSGEVRAVVLVVGDAIAVAVGGCGGRRRIAALPRFGLLRGDLQVGRAVFEAGLDLRAFVPFVVCVGCCSYWLPPTRCRQPPSTARHGEASSRQPACHERHSHRSGTQHSLGVMQTPDPRGRTESA